MKIRGGDGSQLPRLSTIKIGGGGGRGGGRTQCVNELVHRLGRDGEVGHKAAAVLARLVALHAPAQPPQHRHEPRVLVLFIAAPGPS